MDCHVFQARWSGAEPKFAPDAPVKKNISVLARWRRFAGRRWKRGLAATVQPNVSDFKTASTRTTNERNIMKKSVLTILGLLMAATGSFAQGYVNLSTATRQVYDGFTTPSVGVYGNSNIDYALFWAPVGTTDPLPAVGTQFGTRAQRPPVQQVATNGVFLMAVPGAYNISAFLTSAGWTLAINADGASATVGTIGAAGQINYGQFQIAGTIGGNTYEMVLVGWDAWAGVGAIYNGYYDAVGWSNPFNYLTGVSASDPNGQMPMSSAGCANQFGVFPTPIGPEPGQLALAASGAVLLLLFRRRARISEIPKPISRGDQASPGKEKSPALTVAKLHENWRQ